jgi:hypothetical protein
VGSDTQKCNTEPCGGAGAWPVVVVVFVVPDSASYVTFRERVFLSFQPLTEGGMPGLLAVQTAAEEPILARAPSLVHAMEAVTARD